MHPFRDRALLCPRCGKPLASYPERDKWRCRTCNGVLVGAEQLVVEIGPHADAVLDGEPDAARPAIHPCPGCAFPMTPYTIAGSSPAPIELDRCVGDRLVWFDGGEIGKVRAGIPAEDDTPLFTSAMGFLATARAEQTALEEGRHEEIPLVDWPMEPQTSGQWASRKLCRDGSCNGVIENGACSVCGKPATAT
jgi:Zn-finger nucleic acid-binding protein